MSSNQEITLRGLLEVARADSLVARTMYIDDQHYEITDEYEAIDIEETCYVELRGHIVRVEHYDYTETFPEAGVWYTIVVAPREIKVTGDNEPETEDDARYKRGQYL